MPHFPLASDGGHLSVHPPTGPPSQQNRGLCSTPTLGLTLKKTPGCYLGYSSHMGLISRILQNPPESSRSFEKFRVPRSTPELLSLSFRYEAGLSIPALSTLQVALTFVWAGEPLRGGGHTTRQRS